MGATLSVMRGRDRNLHFVLHQARKAAVMEGCTTLSPSLRAQIETSYQQYAECLRGSHYDEPHFARLGMAFCNILLPDFIREQIRDHAEPLTILTNDPALPWEIMHDGREFLALRVPMARVLVVQNQLRGFLRPARQYTPSGSFSALIIADPTEDLPGARQEGGALYDLLRRRGSCMLLQGREATFDSIATNLIAQAFTVIHYCGHVDYDAKSRSSAMRLRGGPLHAQSIVSLFKGSPLVFLNACHSDRVPLDSPQAASLRIENFAQAFMIGSENGVASAVVGTMWQVPDEPEEANRDFVLTFYRYLLKGGSIAEAMRSSRVSARKRKLGPMAWGPYVLYGDPVSNTFPQPEPGAAKAKRTAKESDRRAQRPAEPPPPSAASTSDRTATSSTDAEASDSSPTPIDEDGSPLDTAAREVLHVAMREALAMEQGALTTLHMLIGLCEVEVQPLHRLFEEHHIDRVTVCENARTRSREVLPPITETFGVSPNVERMLVRGARSAKLLAHERITATDLLGALLQCQDAEALAILARAGLPPEKILPHLPTSPTIALDWFDAPTRDAIRHAIGAAQRAHLDFLATPHLLVGLLRTGSLATISVIREQAISIEDLCAALLDAVGEGTPSTDNGKDRGELALHPRAAAILQRAREMAQREGTGQIGEAHLLRSLLEQQGSTTLAILRRHGAEPKLLLAALDRQKEKSRQ